ncbi:MAG: DNA mismatch repair protein MutS [Thermodesulfobacteriota bacterium]
MGSETPMIRQYNKIKKDYPDSILFFRLGDFYEMFFDDAKLASNVLGITLTSRNKSAKNSIPLCGVPYHSAEPYLAKLLEFGHKVAICEQVEDPKDAKGVVERKVVKVLTPGVILDSENLESKSNNYIASIYIHTEESSLSYCDVSTGEFRVSCFKNQVDMLGEIVRLEPKEILIDHNKKDFLSLIKSSLNPLITEIDDWDWDYENSKNILMNHLNVSTLESFGMNGNPGLTISSGVLLNYLIETQMDFMPKLQEPRFYKPSDYLEIDDSTRKNLELLKPLSGESNGPSLLSTIDTTMSAMGGRLIKQWLNYPLKDVGNITKRLDAVGELKENTELRDIFRTELKKINDIERLIGRISTAAAKPRDLGGLRDSTYSISNIKSKLNHANSELLSTIYKELDDLDDIKGLLIDALVDLPPYSSRDGGIFREGFNTELDQLRSIQMDGKKWISELESKERTATGINSLKVGYNKVFGYYIEVTKTNLNLIPENFIRKQTLSNAERFITPELKEFEEKILNAEEKILEIEKDLFEELRLKISDESVRIRSTSFLIAQIDVLCSLAEVADNNGYMKPEVNENGIIDLKDSRHPVVEILELGNGFVPNDILLDKEHQILLITGPNMAGKSTLIRQAALIVILAQIGSFVPVSSAVIGIVDKVFTRVGASDNLAKGLSTFMVEMVETAYILRNSTEESFVILDEIGRGTSTFDGMSIAWAVAEYLHEMGVKTLFATHYHELAQLTHSNPRVKNYNVLVKEEKDKIIFLRRLKPGSSSHSYGIQVAKLAGIPQKVINSSKNILSTLEKVQSKLAELMAGEQILLFDSVDNEINEDSGNELFDELKELDPMNMTPIEALEKLIELKKKIKQ